MDQDANPYSYKCILRSHRDMTGAGRGDRRRVRTSSTRGERVDTALVLAGGRSERFAGAEKSLATLGGEPMIQRVLTRVSPLVDTVVVSCRTEQYDALRAALDTTDADVHLEFAFDDHPDRGPVYGLREGLRAIGGDHSRGEHVTSDDHGCECGTDPHGERKGERTYEDTVIVVACDLPLLEPTLFECLETHIGEGDATIPETSDGQRHPLAGLYRVVPTLEAIAAARSERDSTTPRWPGMFDVLTRLEATIVPPGQLPRGVERMLRNVNTRTALDAVEALLEEETEGRS